jgi:hypothetical protein
MPRRAPRILAAFVLLAGVLLAGCGDQAARAIPASSTLVFDVELQEIG